MAQLLKDLIDIPEVVHKGDFVLRLSEGVADPEGTVRHYVVTPPLAKAFDEALGLIESAVRSKSSKATYLHGSFGSGKSHFMAMLYLLLQRHPAARAVPELAEVVVAHDRWLDGRRVLMVPYHLIGAQNLESAVLGGYAAHVRRLHPDRPAPAVYRDGPLLADAERLRADLGDETFFAKLSATATGAGGWAALAAGWDAARWEAARVAPHGDGERRELVHAVISAFFSSTYGNAATATAAGFVGMDEGLAEISRHARELGYDALVLFLDELILWLASHSANLDFIEHEVQKLVKVVEAQVAERPVPIVSFVARQRDLRELIGEHLPGAARLGFADTLKHWEGRFGQIVLGDTNLPAIIAKRVLAPRSAAAREELDRAFETTLRANPKVVDTLLGDADRDAFRRVFPFSPALVDALVAVSSVLQRERTALKILLELLSQQRDTLEVGQLVPVGDLWPILLDGDEPFTEAMKIHFDAARKVWRERLLPVLEEVHGVSSGAEAPPAFRGSCRLVQTLLLAALAPETKALRQLTVGRLVALNHGSIRAPIAGQEVAQADGRLRDLIVRGASMIHRSGDRDPIVILQLSGVDAESVVAQVQSEDNRGNRMRLVRHLLFEAMGIDDDDQLFHRRELRWKGTRRMVDVLFGNVRELPAESLIGREGWLVVIDYPFDLEGYTPEHDRKHALELLDDRPSGTSTICWLPAFFSSRGQEDLGRLVRLDYLLTGERFDRHAGHLPVQERPSARTILENQRNELRTRLGKALEVAYGLSNESDPLIDSVLVPERHLLSLRPTFEPKPPIATSFREAFDQIAGQALSFAFPGHPNLPPELVTRKELEELERWVGEAARQPDRRLRIDDKRVRERVLRPLAQPLQLGEMHEAHFVAGHFWVDHLDAAINRGARSVGELRKAFDQPEPRGWTKEMQDLVLRLFADRTNRTFRLHQAPVPIGPGQDLRDELVVAEQPMPDPHQWSLGVAAAAALFGIVPLANLLSANTVADLAAKVRQRAGELVVPAERLLRRLESATQRLQLAGTAARGATAAEAWELVDRLHRSHDDVEVIRRLAAVGSGARAQQLGRSLVKAEGLAATLGDGELFEVLEGAFAVAGAHAAEAADLRRALAEAVAAEELVVPLETRLAELRRRGVELLRRAAVAPSPPAPTKLDPAPPPPPRAGWRPRGSTRFDDTLDPAEHLAELLDWVRTDPTRRRLRGELTRFEKDEG